MRYILKSITIIFIALIATCTSLVATTKLLPYLDGIHIVKVVSVLAAGQLMGVWLLISVFRERAGNLQKPYDID